ncbi:MAG: nuclear transport factor 2 family protein [Anaerolineae bacterium]|nr:nuclear transport factor 2 family protein [Anaerolineae bacterium]
MSAIEIVQTFLRTMENRDLDTAQAMMTDDAIIIFPGGKQYATQHDMVASAKGRYQWVKKTFDHIDHLRRDDDTEVVTIMGTLYGVNNQGVAFEGIRYIDRFVLRNGKITEQHVWNDLAETGVL